MKGCGVGSVQIAQANERRDLAVQLSREGLSIQAIAQRLNVNPSSVTRYRRERDVPRNKPVPISAEELDRARVLLEDGATYAEAARTIGRHPSCLRRRLPGFRVMNRTEIAELAALGRQRSRVEAKIATDHWDAYRGGIR